MKEIKDSPFYKDKFIFKEFSPIEFLQWKNVKSSHRCRRRHV